VGNHKSPPVVALAFALAFVVALALAFVVSLALAFLSVIPRWESAFPFALAIGVAFASPSLNPKTLH
jgi:hypothetical protein